jgi:predicted nucleotidyltransferase
MDDTRLAKAKEEFIREIGQLLKDDPAVRSLALIGSHADGTHKPLSDIDLIAVIVDEMAAEYRTDDSWLIGDREVLARHSQGRVVFENLICIDATIVKESELAEGSVHPITRRAIRKAIRPLFDPEKLFQNLRFAIGDTEDSLYTFDEGLDKFCYYALIAAFRIKRDELWLAHDNIFFDMKQILILLLKAHLGVGQVTWVKGALDIDHPLAEAIWNIFPATGDAADLQGALEDIVAVGGELVREIDPDEQSIWPDKFEHISEAVREVLKPMN